MLDKARRIKNPVEAAFFLWVHLAYLQPFEDGNKRTSRLAATYRRSLKKYTVLLQSMGAPDPTRLRYRLTLRAAEVWVRAGRPLEA